MTPLKPQSKRMGGSRGVVKSLSLEPDMAWFKNQSSPSLDQLYGLGKVCFHPLQLN